MGKELSKNEEETIRAFFFLHDPPIEELAKKLTGTLVDKKGDTTDVPDPRFISKLKSIGIRKVTNMLVDLAKAMRLDYTEPKTYSQKKNGILKTFNFINNTYVYIVFTFKLGPVAWFVHNDTECPRCQVGGDCYQILEIVEEERNLVVPPNIAREGTSKKAEWLFNELLNEE